MGDVTTASYERNLPAFRPGVTVAVIGAGISGVCSAAHLLNSGASVTVFERSNIAGGVWHYQETSSLDPSYPSLVPSKGDYVTFNPGEFAVNTPPPEKGPANDLDGHALPDTVTELRTWFCPPGPCYAGLKNNVPTSLMVSSLASWPAGTGEITTQDNIEHYVQSLAAENGVDEVTYYNTRVEEVRKAPDGSHWTVRTLSLKVSDQDVQQVIEKTWVFDAIVVASGHYNLPHVPDFPGLSQWKSEQPTQVIHSKQYRDPQRYKNETVLVIGGGVSALDVCRELDGVAGRIYQSTRDGEYDLPAEMLPPSVQRIGEIAHFSSFSDSNPDSGSETQEDSRRASPGIITLKDGQTVTGVQQVIVATGYLSSYPFLAHLHADSTAAIDAGPDVLVTADGSMVHNLHKDIFYIPDPSLAFVGVPYYISTFSLFDFQAQLVALVITGTVSRLPSERDMRDEYRDKRRAKGVGRRFHSLMEPGAEIDYVGDLVHWANKDRANSAEPLMKGHTEVWKEGYWAMREKMKAAFRERVNSRNLLWYLR